MTKQDERMRLRKRLVERSIEHAAGNDWQEAINDNLRLLELGRDADTLNRLGKAYLEIGDYEKAVEFYRETLATNPTNVVARRNVARLEELQKLGTPPSATPRQHTDPQIFIVETGKTALTTLTNIASNEAILLLTIGERLSLEHDGKNVWLQDSDGRTVGQLEPQLAQRLITMIGGGNRYAAVVANLDAGLVKVLIREVYQAPEQRARVSFPGKLGGDIAQFRTYVQRDLPTSYALDDDLAEDDEVIEEDTTDDTEEDFFRGGTEEEEVGLEEIEADLNNDDDDDEES